MTEFTIGDRVRIDIPDTTDPDFDRYHGEHGRVVEKIEDDAAEITGDDRDGTIYRVEFDTGETADFRHQTLRPPID